MERKGEEKPTVQATSAPAPTAGQALAGEAGAYGRLVARKLRRRAGAVLSRLKPALEPPPEVIAGRLPEDTSPVDVDVGPLAAAVRALKWGPVNLDDAEWPGGVAIRRLFLPETWTGAELAAVTSAAGLRLDLPRYESAAKDAGTGVSLVIRARVADWTAEGEDGSRLSASSESRTSAESTVGREETAGVKVGVDVGDEAGKASAEMSDETTRRAESTETDEARAGGEVDEGAGVRFRVVLRWDVELLLEQFGVGPVEIVEWATTPAEQQALFESSARVRFPRSRCTGGVA